MIKKIDISEIKEKDGSMKEHLWDYYVFEKDEEKYYYKIINQKFGALFFKDILDHIFKNLSKKKWETLKQNNLKNPGVFLKMTYMDFFWSSRYYINKFMPVLRTGHYISISTADDGKTRNFAIRMDFLLALLLPNIDDIRDRCNRLNNAHGLSFNTTEEDRKIFK